MLKYPSMYEFDMKQFFDSVNLDYLHKILLLTGVPETLTKLIMKWNRTLPAHDARHGITWSSPLAEASDYKYHMTGNVLLGHTDYTY